MSIACQVACAACGWSTLVSPLRPIAATSMPPGISPKVHVQAGGDDQVVVLDAPAAVGDHRVLPGIELGDHLAHPLHAGRDQVDVAVADAHYRPHAGRGPGRSRAR